MIKNISYLGLLTGAYIIVFYLKLGERVPLFSAIRLEFLLGSLLLGAALLTRHKDGKVNSKNLSALAIWLIIILFIFTVFSADRDTSVFVFTNHVIKYAALTLFIVTFCRTPSALKFFVFCLLLAWFKLGQEGFLGWLTGGMVWENQGIPRLHGSVGQLAHPNSFSGFGVGTLPFILYLFPLAEKRWQQLALLIMLVFAIIIIMATGSRAGYLAAIIFLLYFLFGLNVNKFKAVLVLICIGILAVLFIPDSYKGRFESIFTQEEAEGHSTQARIIIIEDAIDIFTQYPLGVGVGAFPAVREQMFGRSQDTHNLYLEILTNIGPFGLIVFLLLVNKIIRLNKLNIKTNTEYIESSTSADIQLRNDLRFLIALGKAIIGFMVVRLILGLFGMDLYEIYWWLAIGMTLSINVISYNLTSANR